LRVGDRNGYPACEDHPVVPADMHDFFLASAGVAGALIGLLFVAISVSGERLARAEASAQMLRIRAYAALTGFLNALTVSLWALIPDGGIGTASLVVAILGLMFVAASLLSLIRVERLSWKTARDGLFLAGQAVVFVLQLIYGIQISGQASDPSGVDVLAILVVVCFLIGISRAWELIGGPSIDFTREVAALVHSAQSASEAGADGAESGGTADSRRPPQD
jgi:hypothetical protein